VIGDRITGWLRARLTQILGAGFLIALIGVAVQTVRIGGLEKVIGDLREQISNVKGEYAVFRARIVDRTAQALAADRTNVKRVVADQARISEDRISAYRSRIAALDARVAELRKSAAGGAVSGGRGPASVSTPGAAPGRVDGAAGSDGFSLELRATASRQAIRLDELQKWVRSQGQVDNSGGAGAGDETVPLNGSEMDLSVH